MLPTACCQTPISLLMASRCARLTAGNCSSAMDRSRPAGEACGSRDLTGDPDGDLPIPGAHVRPNHRTEDHNFGTAEFPHEIENVVTVAAAPDAVLVLDRDRAGAAFVQR